MSIRLFFFFALLAACAPGGLTAPATRVFKAGAATSNITPPLGGRIVGNGSNQPTSKHIYDELHVRCLALDDGTTRLAFAVVDSLAVAREVFDEAKRLVQEETGVPVANLMMSATHTHSSVSARGVESMVMGVPLDDYQKFLIRRIADGVRRAFNNLEPARIGWASGQVPQHVFNRRSLLKEGKTEGNPFGGRDRVVTNRATHPERLKPAGPTNPEVYFISVQSTSGRPIGLLANYWLHYVGGAPAAHISADYFGMFCERIQQLLGATLDRPPFVGILANGPCGDVNNSGMLIPKGIKYGPGDRMRLVADDLAQEVARVHRTLQFHDWVELKAAKAELELQMRHPTPEMVAKAKQILARPATTSPIHSGEALYAKRTLFAEKWPESTNVVMQVFRIGGLGVAAIPFETFTETGLEIKAKSPFKDTFTIELANGGLGYLPTPEQHELGGYETWLGTSRVEKEATSKIVAKLLELFGQVQP
jgi:neutral ceramidase